MKGWMDGRGGRKGRMDEMEEWMDGRMEGWMDGRVDGWKGGWMEEKEEWIAFIKNHKTIK